MAKLDIAAQNWQNGVQGKASAWVQGVQNPVHDACAGFRNFVGTESMAVRKYCADYGQFKSNVSAYSSNYNTGISNAITNNSYVKGLTR